MWPAPSWPTAGWLLAESAVRSHSINQTFIRGLEPESLRTKQKGRRSKIGSTSAFSSTCVIVHPQTLQVSIISARRPTHLLLYCAFARREIYLAFSTCVLAVVVRSNGDTTHRCTWSAARSCMPHKRWPQKAGPSGHRLAPKYIGYK